MNYIMKQLSLIIISIFTLLNSPIVNAQTDSTKAANYSDSTENTIFEKVEIEATFPEGDRAWRNFLERTLNATVPVYNRAPEGTYTVVVQFVVDKEGNVSDIIPLTNHGYGMEKEVIRVIKKSPKWQPAMQDGRKVKAYRKQPVTFLIASEIPGKKKNKD